MAQAFPASTLPRHRLPRGLDRRRPPRAAERRRRRRPGRGSRSPTPADLPAGGADLVTMFDCLHDMGDPAAAARAALAALRRDGTLMVVEPMAGDHVEDNLNPVGRVFYGASTLVCTPGSLAQPGAARARRPGRPGRADLRAPRRRLRPRPGGHLHAGQPRHRGPALTRNPRPSAVHHPHHQPKETAMTTTAITTNQPRHQRPRAGASRRATPRRCPAWYAADATITIVDRDHPPAAPAGAVRHAPRSARTSATSAAATSTTTCRTLVADAPRGRLRAALPLPRGQRASSASPSPGVDDGLIASQTIAQSWD